MNKQQVTCNCYVGIDQMINEGGPIFYYNNESAEKTKPLTYLLKDNAEEDGEMNATH